MFESNKLLTASQAFHEKIPFFHFYVKTLSYLKTLVNSKPIVCLHEHIIKSKYFCAFIDEMVGGPWRLSLRYYISYGSVCEFVSSKANFDLCNCCSTYQTVKEYLFRSQWLMSVLKPISNPSFGVTVWWPKVYSYLDSKERLLLRLTF